MIVRYQDYKQFRSQIKVTFEGVDEPAPQPEEAPTSKPNP